MSADQVEGIARAMALADGFHPDIMVASGEPLRLGPTYCPGYRVPDPRDAKPLWTLYLRYANIALAEIKRSGGE